MDANDRLKRLLTFAHCGDEKQVLDRAVEVAAELLRNWTIVTPQGQRRFLAVEFYLFIPGIFEDDAVHCRKEQLERGTFYFHTRSKGDWTPPIFNRHGVDITCGDFVRGIYGGILLRHLSGRGNRDGSGVALRSLVRGDSGFRPVKRGSDLSGWSEGEIGFFRRMNGRDIFGNEMYLIPSPSDRDVEIVALPRIGIDGTRYSDKKLRFVRVDGSPTAARGRGD